MSAKSNVSIDPATKQMLEVADRDKLELVWDRYKAMQPQCGYGQLGLCCKICVMGPCRIDPFGQGLNLYAYCFNNPHSWIDPLGLCVYNKVSGWVHGGLAAGGSGQIQEP